MNNIMQYVIYVVERDVKNAIMVGNVQCNTLENVTNVIWDGNQVRNMTEFSIAIPSHDRGENGPKWMRELLDTLAEQTFQDFDVVVSDQSKNDNIMKVCEEYDFEFVYIQYGGSNACENLNTALDNCDGRIIKIMFSDDIFVKKNT